MGSSRRRFQKSSRIAFYSGWANATSAVVVAKAIFEKRGIKSDELPPASGDLLPIDEDCGSSGRSGLKTVISKR
jgi:hypothetical protein